MTTKTAKPKTKKYIVMESQWVREIVVYKHTITAEEGLTEAQILDRINSDKPGFKRHDIKRDGTFRDTEYGESGMSLVADDSDKAIDDAIDTATDRIESMF